MTGKKVWVLGAATFLLGAGAAFAVAGSADDGPEVTVQPQSAATSDVPQTREGLVTAWTAELRRAGTTKPDGWELLTTEEIRGRYLSQVHANAPDAAEVDPGMVKRD
ncbi:hypothetical protein GCM10010329_60520 [Streptomyces spiroverticillatus]|uniref:DUF4148 domain-containing protein n=1 Tax=Streptomyces finlayi TaxID=67296 RepID=A0A918X3X9_9ACTN|nr:hypothetical protein [Streptomyces finlayi]GHA29114.1 hypothetical protein GCM10010329_60520 [Streptomyces spiroverticillatus]GHD09643.1 hypothetical protein GCM10010334_64180 [Streptomyces finlayi]